MEGGKGGKDGGEAVRGFAGEGLVELGRGHAEQRQPGIGLAPPGRAILPQRRPVLALGMETRRVDCSVIQYRIDMPGKVY